MLIRGGENIYCSEVENVLIQHPAVADAALVGLAASAAGRSAGRRWCRLEPAPRSAKTSLRDFAGERLAAFKVPVQGAIVARPRCRAMRAASW